MFQEENDDEGNDESNGARYARVVVRIRAAAVYRARHRALTARAIDELDELNCPLGFVRGTVSEFSSSLSRSFEWKARGRDQAFDGN